MDISPTVHSKSRVGDWLRISTPRPRRGLERSGLLPYPCVLMVPSIITTEGGTVISRLASTQFSGLDHPHPIGKLRGVIWQGVTGQQGLSWQGLAAYRYLSDSAMSRRPGRELHVQVNSAPVDTYQQ